MCFVSTVYYTRTLLTTYNPGNDTLQHPQMKNFVAPAFKFSFPTPIALLIGGNTANCADIRLFQANRPINQTSD